MSDHSRLDRVSRSAPASRRSVSSEMSAARYRVSLVRYSVSKVPIDRVSSSVGDSFPTSSASCWRISLCRRAIFTDSSIGVPFMLDRVLARLAHQFFPRITRGIGTAKADLETGFAGVTAPTKDLQI